MKPRSVSVFSVQLEAQLIDVEVEGLVLIETKICDCVIVFNMSGTSSQTLAAVLSPKLLGLVQLIVKQVGAGARGPRSR